jgi:hypothetical protein
MYGEKYFPTDSSLFIVAIRDSVTKQYIISNFVR